MTIHTKSGVEAHAHTGGSLFVSVAGSRNVQCLFKPTGSSKFVALQGPQGEVVLNRGGHTFPPGDVEVTTRGASVENPVEIAIISY